MKFTPAGGSIKVESRLNRQGWFVLSVKDSGVGMAAGDIERAWQSCMMANFTWRANLASVPWRKSCCPRGVL